MEVSVELHLLFSDIFMSKPIWLDREDEETASSLHVRKNCKFFLWIGVLQLFWQHYTHPLSCRVLCCLLWQHRCWNWTAWWLSSNVSAEWWYPFTKDFNHGKAPDWTKQKPSRLPAPGLDFHRAALQVTNASEFRLHHWALIQILVQHPLLRCSHWLYHSALSFLLFFLLLTLGPRCLYLCKYPVPHVDLGKRKYISTDTTDILENLQLELKWMSVIFIDLQGPLFCISLLGYDFLPG